MDSQLFSTWGKVKMDKVCENTEEISSQLATKYEYLHNYEYLSWDFN